MKIHAYKYSIFIILSLLILVFVILLLNINKEPAYLKAPISLTTDNNIYREQEFDVKFFEKVSNSSLIPISYSNSHLLYNSHVNFAYKNAAGSVIRFILLDASSFDSSKQLYEKVYTELSPTGSLVYYQNHKIDNLDMALSIMNEPLGEGAYVLNGGIKYGSKGYFFKVFIARVSELTLTEETTDKIFKFSYLTIVPYEFYKVIEELLKEDVPQSYFHEFLFTTSPKLIDTLRKNNKGIFPSTF